MWDRDASQRRGSACYQVPESRSHGARRGALYVRGAGSGGWPHLRPTPSRPCGGPSSKRNPGIAKRFPVGGARRPNVAPAARIAEHLYQRPTVLRLPTMPCTGPRMPPALSPRGRAWPRSQARRSTPRAAPSRVRVRVRGTRWPLSTLRTVLTSTPASRARCSWVSPRRGPGSPAYPGRPFGSERDPPRGRLRSPATAGPGARSRPAPHAATVSGQQPSRARKGSLRQPPVHPALADSLTERPSLVRITPWEHTRSRAADPQVAERQRNGVAAAGSGIPDAAVAARRPRSRSTTRG